MIWQVNMNNWQVNINILQVNIIIWQAMAEICHHRIESYNPIFKIFSKEKNDTLKVKKLNTKPDSKFCFYYERYIIRSFGKFLL